MIFPSVSTLPPMVIKSLKRKSRKSSKYGMVVNGLGNNYFGLRCLFVEKSASRAPPLELPPTALPHPLTNYWAFVALHAADGGEIQIVGNSLFKFFPKETSINPNKFPSETATNNQQFIFYPSILKIRIIVVKFYSSIHPK